MCSSVLDKEIVGVKVKEASGKGMETAGCLDQDTEGQRTAGQELRTQRVCGRLAMWEGGAGQGGQARGSRKGEASGQAQVWVLPRAGAGQGEDSGVHALPSNTRVLLPGPRRLCAPTDWLMLSSLRPRVSAPAGQDLGG